MLLSSWVVFRNVVLVSGLLNISGFCDIGPSQNIDLQLTDSHLPEESSQAAQEESWFSEKFEIVFRILIDLLNSRH